MINDKECSVCNFSEEMVDIERDNKGRLIFQRCPNCGATFSTSYDNKSGGSTTWVYNPGADYSDTAIFRIIVGAIIFGIGCWQGLGYGGGICGLIGVGIFIWGWIVRKEAIDRSNHIKNVYPYWSKKRENSW